MELNNLNERLKGHLLPVSYPYTKSRISEVLGANGLTSHITLANQMGEKVHVPLTTNFTASTSINGNVRGQDGASSSSALTLNISDLKQLQGLIVQQVKQIQMQQQQLAALLDAQQTIIDNASLLQEQEQDRHKNIQNDLLLQILHKYNLTPKTAEPNPPEENPQSIEPPIKLEASIHQPNEAILLPPEKFYSSARNSNNERDSMGSSNTNDDIPIYDNLPDHDAIHTSIGELEEFAKFFKKKRIELGFNQTDIGVALGKLYGSDFSQTTISRFEALNLSYKNMVRLKPLLDRFLADVNTNGAANIMQKLNFDSNGEANSQDRGLEMTVDKREDIADLSGDLSSSLTYLKKRKKRTLIENDYKDILENFYELNQRPGQREIDFIAKQASLDKEVVKIWFGNRRQKDKKFCKPHSDTIGSLDMSSLMSLPAAESYPPISSSYADWNFHPPSRSLDYPSSSSMNAPNNS